MSWGITVLLNGISLGKVDCTYFFRRHGVYNFPSKNPDGALIGKSYKKIKKIVKIYNVYFIIQINPI